MDGRGGRGAGGGEVLEEELTLVAAEGAPEGREHLDVQHVVLRLDRLPGRGRGLAIHKNPKGCSSAQV